MLVPSFGVPMWKLSYRSEESELPDVEQYLCGERLGLRVQD